MSEKIHSGGGSERFIRFLAKLGTMINVKEVSAGCFVDDIARDGSEMAYGLLWKNELTQVFFYVNTLMRFKIKGNKVVLIEDYKHIQEYIQKTNVVIIWNETGKEIKSEDLSNSVAIVINPLPVNYCVIKIVHKTNNSYQSYGSLTENTIVNDAYISKLVLKCAIVIDIKRRMDSNEDNKQVYISELLSRCSMISTIKKEVLT